MPSNKKTVLNESTFFHKDNVKGINLFSVSEDVTQYYYYYYYYYYY